MDTTIINAALSQGIWAVLAVFLLIYLVKGNAKRDDQQAARETDYQKIIQQLLKELQELSEVKNNTEELKNLLLSLTDDAAPPKDSA